MPVKKKGRAEALFAAVLADAGCAPLGETQEQLLAAIFEAMSVAHVRMVGGYPDEIRIVKEPAIVIAGLFGDAANGEPSLRVIPLGYALKRFERAKVLLETEQGEDAYDEVCEAFSEVGLDDDPKDDGSC